MMMMPITITATTTKHNDEGTAAQPPQSRASPAGAAAPPSERLSSPTFPNEMQPRRLLAVNDLFITENQACSELLSPPRFGLFPFRDFVLDFTCRLRLFRSSAATLTPLSLASSLSHEIYFCSYHYDGYFCLPHFFSFINVGFPLPCFALSFSLFPLSLLSLP